LKSCCVLQDHYDDERNKTMFHNTTPDLQDQDQDQDYSVQDQDWLFWSWDWSCPKTDGLGPHHWHSPSPGLSGKIAIKTAYVLLYSKSQICD